MFRNLSESRVSMESNNKFIGIVNEINQFLIDKYNLHSNSTFGAAIEHVKNVDRLVKYEYDFLDLVKDLRNVIVHKSYQEGPVAVPRKDVVDRLEVILKKLKYPTFIASEFKSNVISFNDKDTLDMVLDEVSANDYTQFPIFSDSGLVGLLTENGITKWLASKKNDGIIEFNDIKIKEILSIDENSESYRVLEHNKTVYDVIDVFNKRSITYGSLTILIAKAFEINKSEDIAGIITHWDIKDYIQK